MSHLQKLIQNRWDLSAKPKTIKLPKENKEENLYDLDRPRFLRYKKQANKTTWSIKEKVGSLDFIKIKNVCSLRDTI